MGTDVLFLKHNLTLPYITFLFLHMFCY